MAAMSTYIALTANKRAEISERKNALGTTESTKYKCGRVCGRTDSQIILLSQKRNKTNRKLVVRPQGNNESIPLMRMILQTTTSSLLHFNNRS